MVERRDTIVIGASAGGVEALRELLAPLPRALPAAVLVVQHQGEGPGGLDRLLGAVTALPVAFAGAPEPIRTGRVYLAPPDRHMVIDGERVLVNRGPREMRTRPAINPLFRTAAAGRRGRVIAVQLSGLLDDGVAGLDAVRRCGGLVLVQDPAEALCPDMPRHALDAVGADQVAPLARLAALLDELAGTPAPNADVPEDVRVEALLSARPDASRPAALERLGDQVAMSCPDCGGPLWRDGRGEFALYRCHVGHALSARALLGAQSDEIERSLWVAARSLTERATLLGRLAEDAEERGARAAEAYRERADEVAVHAENTRRFLLSLRERKGAEHAGETAAEHLER